MSPRLTICVHRDNTAVVFSPDPGDGTQTVFGPLVAGQTVVVERGSFLNNDVRVDIWDWDEYQASLTAQAQQ